MATYKHPRVVEFVDALPKSATGKVQWRMLQEAEMARGWLSRRNRSLARQFGLIDKGGRLIWRPELRKRLE